MCGSHPSATTTRTIPGSSPTRAPSPTWPDPMPSKAFRTGETVDFVVVGSGASGGVMARELSRAGHSVVVMEQGPRMSPADFEHDELKYSQLQGILNSPINSPQTIRDDPSKKAVRKASGNNPLT